MSFKSAFIIAANSCLFSASFDFYFWSVCAMYKWCVCLLVLEPVYTGPCELLCSLRRDYSDIKSSPPYTYANKYTSPHI